MLAKSHCLKNYIFSVRRTMKKRNKNQGSKFSHVKQIYDEWSHSPNPRKDNYCFSNFISLTSLKVKNSLKGLHSQLGLQNIPNASLHRGKTLPPMSVQDMTLKNLIVGNAEQPFITIASRATLVGSSSTW